MALNLNFWPGADLIVIRAELVRKYVFLFQYFFNIHYTSIYEALKTLEDPSIYAVSVWCTQAMKPIAKKRDYSWSKNNSRRTDMNA